MVKDEETLSQENCLLLAYELLYLWNALGACLKHSHATIQIGKIYNLSKNLISKSYCCQNIYQSNPYILNVEVL